jgi:hypothetical protein
VSARGERFDQVVAAHARLSAPGGEVLLNVKNFHVKKFRTGRRIYLSRRPLFAAFIEFLRDESQSDSYDQSAEDLKDSICSQSAHGESAYDQTDHQSGIINCFFDAHTVCSSGKVQQTGGLLMPHLFLLSAHAQSGGLRHIT